MANDRDAARTDPEETRQTAPLEHATGLVKGRVAPLAAGPVAALVVRVTRGGDGALRDAAVEALRRRLQAAERDELKVAKRPAQAQGLYALKSKERGTRPYTTLVTSAATLEGSCDCRDYVRSGLALCKHLVVAFVSANEPRGRGKAKRLPVPARAFPPRFTWDPVRPLTGVGDPLERLGFTGKASALPAALRDDLREERLVPPPATNAGERLSWVRALHRSLERRAALGLDDPAILPMLVDEQTRLDRLLAGAALVDRLDAHLEGLKRKLFAYQREGVSEALRRGWLLLADDMGLGKTAQAIAACHALSRSGKGRKVLVVVPASLRIQWSREWAAWSDVPVTVVEGPAHARWELYRRTKAGALVASYETVVRDIEELCAWAPDVVVLDEAQRLKNWQTKTAANVKRLSPKFRLVLTGTPFENRLEELASLMDWVDDHALEPKWRLPAWHLVRHPDGTSGARHLDTLRTRLAPAMLRRRKAEVLTQLPERTDTRVPVELTKAQAAEHDELDPSIAQLVGRDRPLTQPEFLRLMQMLTTQRMLCNGLALARYSELGTGLENKRPTEAVLESLSSPKLGEFRELVENLALTQERKVVVFSQWRRMLALAHWAVKDLLAKEGVRAVFFTGDESQAERARNVEAFHDDPGVRVFFATDAGGVGLNLQRAAATLVNLELPWNPAVLEQRIGRIWRLGQKSHVEIYHLVCQTGIESRIAGIVGNKQALFSGLFDGGSDTVAFDSAGSFREKVRALIEPAPAGHAGVAPAPEAEISLDAGLEQPSEPSQPQPFAEPTPVSASPAPAAAASLPMPAIDLGSLLSRVRVERTAEGGLRLEAPPEAALPLAELFAGMARLFAQASNETR